MKVGVVAGQCAACGELGAAEWSVTLIRDSSSDMRGYWRLCDGCKQSMMTHLEERPEVEPLRGYR